MYFATSPMWSAIGVPMNKAPMNYATFALYVLPPLLTHVLMAVLAITPQTRYLRVACWPIAALLALRAAVSVDISLSSFERKFYCDLATPMLMIATHSLYWASVKEPFVKKIRLVNSTPSTLMNALDLAIALRGYGWDWSHGLHIPRETRPSSRTGFALYVTLSAAVHALIFGILHRAIQSFSPMGLGSIPGGSIFDETLPFLVRYFRSSVISLVGCFTAYSLLQMCYDLCTLAGIFILGQDPAQWPPGFDTPWRATSLSDFCGRRWHQWSRHIHLVQGGYPLSFFFGRAGLVIGTFLSNAVNHYIILYTLDATSELWRMLIGFGMLGPVVLAERAFKRLTGRKVCGLAGWVWTVTWLLLSGNVIIDAFVRAGAFGPYTLIDGVPSLRALVERLVMGFDAWLYAV